MKDFWDGDVLGMVGEDIEKFTDPLPYFFSQFPSHGYIFVGTSSTNVLYFSGFKKHLFETVLKF